METIRWNPIFDIDLSGAALFITTERDVVKLAVDLEKWGCRELFKKLLEGIPLATLAHLGRHQRELISSLLDQRYLVIFSSDCRSLISDRNAGYFLARHVGGIGHLQHIRECTIGILGVGGVGSVVLQHLIGLGVRKFALVDADAVETSNFNRQFLYGPDDVGQLKVEVAGRYIKSRVAEVDLWSSSVRLGDQSDFDAMSFPACDLLLNCMDTPRGTIDQVVHRYAWEKGIASIGCGVGITMGHWGPLIAPGVTVDFDEWEAKHCRRSIATHAAQEREPTRWSIGLTNTLVAAHLTKDCVDWLCAPANVPSLGRRVVLDFLTTGQTIYG